MYEIKKFFLNFLLRIKTFKEKKQNERTVQNIKKQGDFTNSKVKNSLNQGASLHLNSVTEEQIKKVEKISEKIIKKHFGDIPKTVKILEKRGIRVYQTRFAVKILGNVNEKQGFITPLKGFKAFYLSFMLGLLCDKKLVFKTKTKEMFVFSKQGIDNFYLASQVYKFIAFEKNLAGFEYEIQEKFKKIYKRPNAKNFNTLTAGEIFALKEAIARDIESVDFATKLHDEIELTTKFGKKEDDTTNS